MQRVGSSRASFSLLRQDAIKNGLSNILGQSGAVAVIINFNLDTAEDDPKSFHVKLSSVFRHQAEILEKAIIKELYSRLGEVFHSSESFDFATHMNFAKQLFSAKTVNS
jgi:hypothetical protein